MRRLLFAIALLAALLAGCGKQATEPPAVAGSGGLPPALFATQPPPRSTSAAYDGEIWAQFDRPLDGRTVSPLTVFLKLDGQRVPSAISYDGITRRIFIRPSAVLALQRTYTAEFSTVIKSLDGVPLPEGVFFQFTTNSLRRLSYDFPVANASEGALSALGWGGDGSLDGNLFYDVFASTDSLAVARRASPVLQRSVFRRYLPAVAWPAGQRIYWAVTSENLATHEREDAPVRSFGVLPAPVGLDSVVVRSLDHGSSDIRNRNVQSCNSQTLPSGPGFNACIHWNYGTIPPNVRVVSATLKLYVPDVLANTMIRTTPAAWMAQNDWVACSVTAPGPPFIELSGLLGTAVPVGAVQANLDTPRFAAFVEAMYRRRSLLFGTLIRTPDNLSLVSPLSLDVSRAPHIVVRYHALPPGVQD